MANTIRILPSGHDFTSERYSNLLEAGLSAGLALGYGCSNGNCGMCLARVVSGEVKKVRHHDFPISEEKRGSGHVLMCCHTALTDVVLEAPEASDSSEIPQQHISTRVKGVVFPTRDVALIHLKTPRTNRLRFLAGQYVKLSYGDTVVAHHSIGSCPCDDMNLHFQIPRVSGDAFSDHVFSHLKKGDVLDVNGPFGDFVLNETCSRPLIFIAWQTGFAPVRSLIEHAMALDLTEDMRLMWITDSKTDRYLDNLCRSWNDALDNFSYIPFDTRLMGNINHTGSIIERLGIEPGMLASHDFYIAATDRLQDSLGQFLINEGLPRGQLRSEQKDQIC